MLAGSNSADTAGNRIKAATKDEFFARFGKWSAEAKAAYDPDGSTELATMVSRANDDFGQAEPARFAANAFAANGSPAYLYRFSYVASAMRERMRAGAPHGGEIGFVFGTLGGGPGPASTPSPEDLAVSKMAQSYWVNFARTGDPNGAGLPAWPRHDPEEGRDLRFPARWLCGRRPRCPQSAARRDAAEHRCGQAVRPLGTPRIDGGRRRSDEPSGEAFGDHTVRDGRRPGRQRVGRPDDAHSQAVAETPRSVRLYVFDCGTLHIADMERFRLTREEVATTDLSVPCFLVAHPKGTLLWDAGVVPDTAWKPTGAPVKHRLVLPGGAERDLTMRKALTTQLAEVGYSAADVTYLALSHYHYDHTANANAFARATWLVRQAERDAMFADPPPAVTHSATYAALRESKTRIIDRDDHDVFGDGTVLIKSAPGHTSFHQVLYVKLAKTGGVVLSGDLYHYAAARELKRLPTFDVDQDQSALTRAAVERFLKESGAQLWIQHDFTANARLKKSPLYYD